MCPLLLPNFGAEVALAKTANIIGIDMDFNEFDETELQKHLITGTCSICWDDGGQVVSLHRSFEHNVHLDCFSFYSTVKGLDNLAKCPECDQDVDSTFASSTFINSVVFKFASLCRYGSVETAKSFIKKHKIFKTCVEVGCVAAYSGRNVPMVQYLMQNYKFGIEVQTICYQISVQLIDYNLLICWKKDFDLKKIPFPMIPMSSSMNIKFMEHIFSCDGFWKAKESPFLSYMVSKASIQDIITYLNSRKFFIRNYGPGIFRKENFCENDELLAGLAVIHRRLDVLKYMSKLEMDFDSKSSYLLNFAHVMGFDEIKIFLLQRGCRWSFKSASFMIIRAMITENWNELTTLVKKHGVIHAHLACDLALKLNSTKMLDRLISLGVNCTKLHWILIHQLMMENKIAFLCELMQKDPTIISYLFYRAAISGKLDLNRSLLDIYEEKVRRKEQKFTEFRSNIIVAFYQALAERRFDIADAFWRRYSNIILCSRITF